MVNETDCKFSFQGKEFSAHGAFVSEKYACVYVKRTTELGDLIQVTDWHGNILGYGRITKQWRQCAPNAFPFKMWSVRFSINDVNYSGRFCPDSGELVKAKRVKK